MEALQLGEMQIVVVDGKEKSFFSYGSFIAKWDGSKLVLSDKWDYSRTTTKYLLRFIREYTTMAEGLECSADVRKAIASGAVEVGND